MFDAATSLDIRLPLSQTVTIEERRMTDFMHIATPFQICFLSKRELRKKATEKLAWGRGIQPTAFFNFFLLLITKTLSREHNHLFPQGSPKPLKLSSV